MNKTKVTRLTQDNRLSYGIKVETDKKDFVIPVIDVRDGEQARKQINQMIKSQSRSKFTNPTYSAGVSVYTKSPSAASSRGSCSS